jgi:predicted ATP-grasp superfamily ATP-dependent carboligase
VSVLIDGQGDCVAWFVHERLREYPLSGGPSTDRRSVHDARLVELSLALLRRLGWRGIAMVEWKMGQLLEINPRFWGSLELAIRAGVDFPVLYARAASGDALGPPPSYPDGVRCRWVMPGEILRYLGEPRTRRERLRDFVRDLPGQAEEWDRRDVRGTLASVVCTGALALNPRYWAYVLRG